MNNNECLELRARDIFFRKLSLTTCEMHSLVRQPLMFVFVGLTISAFVAFDAGSLWNWLAVWQVMVVWVVAICLHILLYHAQTLLWAYAQDRWNSPRLFLPFANLTAFAISYPLTISHIRFYSQRPLEEMLNYNMMFNGIVFILIFEALFFAFVQPLLLAAITSSPTKTNRSITISGEEFEISRIHTLKGQEHYVMVTNDYGTHRVRARLCDLVSQTNDSEGILAHRSHWVSRRAIAGLEREKGTDIIVTHAGERLPVARPRQQEVRSWMAGNMTDDRPA